MAFTVVNYGPGIVIVRTVADDTTYHSLAAGEPFFSKAREIGIKPATAGVVASGRVDAIDLHAPEGVKRAAPVFEVLDFGAVGDGRDDHDALQAAIDAAADARCRVRVSQGEFAILRPLRIPSNSTIEWDNGAVVYGGHYFEGGEVGLLTMTGAHDITLINPQLDRRGDTNAGNKCYGVYADRTLNVSILGGKISNMKWDGIYLTDTGGASKCPCDYWTIRDTMIVNSGRNGLSIISARFSTFDGMKVIQSANTGIDIEPDNVWHLAVGLLVRNCVLNDNNNIGLVILDAFGNPLDRIGHLSVIGNSIEQNARGIRVGSFAPVSLIGNVVRNNNSGIYLMNTLPVIAVGNLIDGGNVHVEVLNTQVTEIANWGWNPVTRSSEGGHQLKSR
jgi:hypothetical protein